MWSQWTGWSAARTFGVKVMAVLLFVIKDNMQGALAATVYFNSYGQCNAQRDYSLSDEVYTARATGAPEIHETLICDMTFRAPPDNGICLTFKEFDVRDSLVSLHIYHKQTASGVEWKRLTTDSLVPEQRQMCTPERFVTLRLQKRRLNNNKGYSFEIQIEKSNTLKGEDVILASSIGLFVGIIVGVVALIIFIAVVVLCCCCKPCKSQQLGGTFGSRKEGVTPASDGAVLVQPPVLPTAPPALELEDETSLLGRPQQQHQGPPAAGAPLYPALPQHNYPAEPYPGTEQQGWPVPEQPPPYDPPPYEQHANAYPTKP